MIRTMKAELPDVRRQFGFWRFCRADALLEGVCGVDSIDDLVSSCCDNIHFSPTDGAYQVNPSAAPISTSETTTTS